MINTTTKKIFKMKIEKFLLLIIISFVFVGCGNTPATSEDSTVTIGTFNIAWLGDGIRDRKDRTEADYQQIADVIKETGADLLGLQEIENEQALERLLKYLPDYSFLIGEKGRQQNLAVLFKKGIQVKLIGEYIPLIIEKRRTRPALIIEARKGNFDWLMMVVHLKSTSHWDNTPEKKIKSRELRLQQAQKISFWADSILGLNKEMDLIITGDFNDYPNRMKDRCMKSIVDNESLIFITEGMTSCKKKTWKLIDHIVGSTSAMNRYVKNSRRIYNFFSSLPAIQAKLISDHCPVIAQFDITAPDND